MGAGTARGLLACAVGCGVALGDRCVIECGVAFGDRCDVAHPVAGRDRANRDKTSGRQRFMYVKIGPDAHGPIPDLLMPPEVGQAAIPSGEKHAQILVTAEGHTAPQRRARFGNGRQGVHDPTGRAGRWCSEAEAV